MASRRRWAAGAVLGSLVAGLTGGSCPAGARCAVTPLARLPLVRAGGHLLAKVVVDGRPANLLLDTGAAVSALDRRFATTLPAAAARGAAAPVLGLGGVDARSFRQRRVGRLDLGAVAITGLRVIEGDLRRGRPTGAVPLDGILGLDVLGRYDLEVDAPAGALVLHAATGCGPGDTPAPAYGNAVVASPFFDGRLRTVPVLLEGHGLAALIDTGATQSVLFPGAARRIGARAEAGDPHGFGLGAGAGRRVPVRLHRFASLRLGTTTLPDVDLALAATEPLRLDMVLGLDVLGRNAFWLSAATGTLFLKTP